MHTADHAVEHAEAKHPSTIGKLIMLVVVFGGFWIVNKMIIDKTIPFPAWAVMLMFAITGILIGGSSNLVPEERGGRIATYAGFVLAAIGILLMINGWIFHAAGK